MAGIRGPEGYSHQEVEWKRSILRWLIDNIGFRFLARYDGAVGLENVPKKGPGIIIHNHIAFIDPIVVLASLPRNVVPMARHDVYRIPIWGIFPRLWEVIPVRRGEVDRGALRHALAVLEAGEMISIAPEGTRNPSMRRGKEGVAYLGARSGAPIIPAAVTGTSGYPTLDFRKWRSQGALVTFGPPFRFRPVETKLNRDRLRKMTDEAMFRIAILLPEERRGVYGDPGQATTETIELLQPATLQSP